MKVYISGPIAGMPDSNKTAFMAMSQRLALLRTRNGIRVFPVNPHLIRPHQHLGDCPEGYVTADGHSSACYLRADLEVLLKCDAMVMLRDYKNSKGCALEREVARMCGIPIYEGINQFMVSVCGTFLESE